MEQYIAKVTEIMREADQLFQTTGGSTRHYVRDLLLPMFEQAGLKIVDAEPSPAKAEQEGPWVKASDRLPEIADGVTKLKIDGKEAEGVWSATEQAFIVGGHRYPPTLYYIEWLDEKKRREQEGPRWVPIVEGMEFPKDREMVIMFDTGELCMFSDEMWPFGVATHYLVVSVESTPPVKEAADPETAAKEASAILLNAMKAAGLNNHIRIIANHEGIDYQLSFERAKEAGQPTEQQYPANWGHGDYEGYVMMLQNRIKELESRQQPAGDPHAPDLSVKCSTTGEPVETCRCGSDHK